MGGEDNFDGFIDIAPFRMMIVLFGGQRDPRHKSECLAEIAESKRLADRLSAVLAGETPVDDTERLALAPRAYDTGYFALATRLWREAHAPMRLPRGRLAK